MFPVYKKKKIRGAQKLSNLARVTQKINSGYKLKFSESESYALLNWIGKDFLKQNAKIVEYKIRYL